MEGMGKETLSFPLLKSGKRQKVHFGRSVSTHFVADCRFKNYSRLLVAYLRPDNESCHGHHGAGKYFCVHDEV